MFLTKRLIVLATTLVSTAAYADVSSTPHLSIDDIDQLAREKVARQLKSGDQPASQPQVSTAPPPAPSSAAVAPVGGEGWSRTRDSAVSRYALLAPFGM